MGGKSRICEICGVREKDSPGFFASFPKDELRCRSWVQIVGKQDLVHVPIEKLHELRHICRDHFEKRDFKRNGLRKRAYPKLKLSAPPLTDEQLLEFPLHVASKSGELKTREARLYVNTKARDDQIDAAPEIEVEDSGGETLFSWQKTELIEADEPEEAPAPAPAPPADPTLTLVCDSGPDPDPDPDLHPDQAVPSGPVPEDNGVENRCTDCREINDGFELWCVQCSGGAMCGACAVRPPHHAHYVLRAPLGAARTVTQTVLVVIRQQLQNETLLSPHETVDVGLKVEVKDEPSENPPAESGPPAEPDPLACEPHDPHKPQEPHSPHSPLSSQEPHSPHSSRESDSPLASATHDADKCMTEKIVDHHKPRTTLPRLRKTTDHAHKNLTLTARRKLVKVSPKEVKYAFLSHIERIVTTQQKQLKASQPPIKDTSQTLENLVTQHNKVRESTHGGTLTGITQHEQIRGPPAPVKITSESEPSETVIIDLDDVADEETIEYLEEGLDSDIEILDEHLSDEHEGEVLDESYLVEEDYLIVDDQSEEDRVIVDIAGRGVKRKNDVEESLPMRGPSESMVRALPSKAVVQMRPLSSLEIRNWTADRKRLKKD